MNEPEKKIADGIRKRQLVVKENTAAKALLPAPLPISDKVVVNSEANPAKSQMPPLVIAGSDKAAASADVHPVRDDTFGGARAQRTSNMVKEPEKSTKKSGEEEIIIMEAVSSKKDKGVAPKVASELRISPGVSKPRRHLGRSWWGISSALIVLGVVIILVSTVFARVTITLQPRVEKVSFEDIVVRFDVSASKLDLQNKVIPAEQLEFSRVKTGEFQASGRENVQEKAQGKVEIFNRFSSSPQRLVATTRFMTESGTLYRLPQSITIPGAKIEQGKIVPQFVEATLVADKPGETYNLEGQVILNIPGFKGTPKYNDFYAVAPSGFSGGFRGEAVVVTKDDLAAAEETITKDIFEEVKQEISRKVPAGFILAEGLREIEIVRVESPREKTKREKFPVEVETRGRILIFQQSDILTLLKELVLKNDTSKMFLDESANLEYVVRSATLEKGIAEADIRGEIKAKSIIPEAVLAEFIRGKKEGSLVELFKSRQDIAAFHISFFPPWIFSAPDDVKKVKFVVE